MSGNSTDSSDRDESGSATLREITHERAKWEYEFWKEHGRPDGPYKMVCTGCDEHWEQDGTLTDADHAARWHAGEHSGLYDERAEIAVTDACGRELYRIHALPNGDGGHPMFADPICDSCGQKMKGVSCGNCGHIPEESRA